MKTIDFINFKRTTDSELLWLLNAMAPYEYQTPHGLARKILLETLRAMASARGVGPLGFEITPQSVGTG